MMGYYKQKEIENQTEIGDRLRGRRRSTHVALDTVITDRRTMLILLGSSMFFAMTTICLTFVVAWLI